MATAVGINDEVVLEVKKLQDLLREEKGVGVTQKEAVAIAVSESIKKRAKKWQNQMNFLPYHLKKSEKG